MRACGRIEGRPAAVASQPRHATTRPGTRRDARPARGGHTRPRPAGVANRRGLIDGMRPGSRPRPPCIGRRLSLAAEGRAGRAAAVESCPCRAPRRHHPNRAEARRGRAAACPRVMGRFRGMESTNPDVWWWWWSWWWSSGSSAPRIQRHEWAGRVPQRRAVDRALFLPAGQSDGCRERTVVGHGDRDSHSVRCVVVGGWC